MLAVGLVELVILLNSSLEFRQMDAVAERVFSAEEWASITVSYRFQWAIQAAMAFLFLVQFATWTLPQKERGAALRDGICLGVMALCWGGSALLIPLSGLAFGGKLLWWVLMAATLAGAAHAFWKYGTDKKQI